MKYVVYLLSLTLLMLAILACGNDAIPEIPNTPDPEEPGDLSFESFETRDTDNTGTPADVQLKFTIKSDLTILKDLHLIAAQNTITLEDALSIPKEQALQLNAQESYIQNLPVSMVDVEGNQLIEGINYNLYVLATFIDDQLTPNLSTAYSMKFSNEAVVITPQLSGEFSGSEDIAIDNQGNLYVNGGSTSVSNIFKVTPVGESSIFSTGFSHPVGIDIDDAGNLYVSNFRNTTINKVGPDGTSITWADDSRLSGGGGIALGNNGTVYNTFWATTSLFNITEGEVGVHCRHPQFDGPIGITYDRTNEQLFVASFNSGKIFRVDDDGTITEVADTPISIGHMAYFNDHFYVTGWKEHQVLKVSADGNIVETYGSGISGTEDGQPGDAKFSQPNGIAVTPDGKYIYVSQGNGKLRKIVNQRVD